MASLSKRVLLGWVGHPETVGTSDVLVRSLSLMAG